MPKTDESKAPQGDKKATREEGSKTQWEVFDEGSFIPIRLTCQSYAPVHQQDSSCHTNLVITSENVQRHLAPEHGASGGFEVHLRVREGAKTSFWSSLAEDGLELVDFRCDVCDEKLPLIPRRIANHIQPHSGKSRMARQGGKFLMTFRGKGQDHQDGTLWDEEL